MRALLDVNVLVALFDADHVHHRLATAWLAANADTGWATCPATQHGLLRILSHPSYPHPTSLQDAATRLASFAAAPQHEAWADGCFLVDQPDLDWSRVLAPRQVPDLHLLALAVQHGGRLVTLDRRIPHAALGADATRHLNVLA